MPYAPKFVPADNVIQHLAANVIPQLNDPVFQMQYTGFAAVSAVTVYELAIKTIFIEFAAKKHKVLGHFVEYHFDRLNGRIGLRQLKEEHIPRFGQIYLNRFKTLLDKEEAGALKTDGVSIRSSYGNLVAWRNEFAHEGRITNATFPEVVRAYKYGKQLIACLAGAMVR